MTSSVFEWNATAIDDTAAVVVLEGRCDAPSAVDLRAGLSSTLSETTKNLIFDLAAVTFFDSAALAVLVTWRRLCASRGGEVVLIAPRSADARRVFSLTQFDEVFLIVDVRGHSA